MLIDTHCHLDFSQFDSDRNDVIRRAAHGDIESMINIGSSADSSLRAKELADTYDAIFFSVGLHPHHADTFDKAEVEEGQLFGQGLRELMAHKKLVAIGEVGLDYYKSAVDRQTQKKTFVEFVALAQRFSMPLVIHSRESSADTLAILEEEMNNFQKVVFHCFSGPLDFFNRCLERGALFSFTANITYPNATALRELVKMTPLESMMLETDAPYLAPQQKRGTRNEPAYLYFTAQEVAALKQVSVEDVAFQTTANARRFFGLDEKMRHTS